MKKIVSWLLPWIFVLGWFNITQAQNLSYRFINYDTDQGMPDNHGRCGIVDSRGLLWVGTEDGLASFDGRTFTNYFHDKQDSNSLAQNFVVDIAEDKNGMLWISTANSGLCTFNPRTQAFNHIQHSPKDTNSIPGNNLGNIYIDRDGLIWVSTYREGFFSYNPISKHAEQYDLPGYSRRFAWDSNTPHSFADDPVDSNILWVSARNGLYRFNKKSGAIQHIILSKPPNSTVSYTIGRLSFRTPTELWLSGWGCGLKRYNTQTGQLDSYYYNTDGKRRNSVLDFAFINDSLVWVATQTSGVGQFNLNTKKFNLLPVEPDKPYAMHETDVNTIVSAGKGQYWFVTYGAGIALFDPANQGFSFYDLPNDPKKRSIDFAADTLNERVYVSSRPGNYLYAYNYSGGLEKAIPLPFKLDDHSLWPVMIDHRGEVWILGSGIYRYKPRTDEVERFSHPLIDALQKEGKRAFGDIIEDKQHNLWLLRISGGLASIDSTRTKVHIYEQSAQYPNAPGSTVNVTDLFLDRLGRVWIVHELGLTCFSPKTKRFTFYNDEDWGVGISPSCLTQDKSGAFWLGTIFNGLLKLVEIDGELILKDQIIRKDGLPSELINAIAIDKGGELWMGTSKGVVRYHPFTKVMRIYGTAEGVNELYSYGDINVLANDKLYVSQLDGFCVLDLKKNYANLSAPGVMLQEIKVFGKALALDTALDYKRHLVLGYKQDFFTIRYRGVSFSQPDRVQYAYKLQGFDADWVYQPSSGTVAVYTGVKPGDYTFIVKAANAAGIWSEPREIRIVIVPPFWQTWWFYLMAVLLGMGVLLYLSYLRTRSVRRKERLKADFEKQLADMELTALRAQMNPHFIFNCLNSIKHLIQTENNKEATTYLMYFAKLIRMVLNFSAKEKIPLSDELKMVERYVQMEKLRFEEGFAFKITTDPNLDLDLVQLPPLILQPFVENAIWHGLLHKAGGAQLNISVEEDNEMLLCIIDDNGIGREKARSLRSKSAASNKSYGLKLAGQRLKLFNALSEASMNIDLKIIDKFDDDSQPIGTTVILKIPLWKI